MSRVLDRIFSLSRERAPASGRLPNQYLESQQGAYHSYVDRVVSPVPESPLRFQTNFRHSPGSTWTHGWDLVLAAGEAVGRSLPEEEQIIGIDKMKFSRSVHGNLTLQVSETELPKSEASVSAALRTSRGRIFSVQGSPNGIPSFPNPGILLTSPLVVGALDDYVHNSAKQGLQGIPRSLVEGIDLEQKGVLLSDVFSLLAYAGSRTLSSNRAGTLIARVENLRIPRFSTFSNPRTEIHSTPEGEPWFSKKGMQMQAVRSTFIAPRNGPDGSCITTFALPTQEQWEALPD